jgi:O-antigen/teichoic acid export membrane protein
MIASQVFVQISSRISLPVFAQAKSFENRWDSCLYQIRLLAIFTVPLLIVALLVVPDVNAHFFNGRWRPAIGLLPLLFLRMLASLATTSLGPLVFVQKGGRCFAGANFHWMLLEFAAAAIALPILGPGGLAWSYAGIVWLGIGILLHALTKQWTPLAGDIGRIIFLRPSLAVAAALACLVYFSHPFISMSPMIGLAAVITALSYLSEQEIRGFLKTKSWTGLWQRKNP